MDCRRIPFNFTVSRCHFLLALLVVLLGSSASVGMAQEKRKKITPKPSSEAQLAKGEINFDDLVFDIEKDAAFESSMWTDRLKRINKKKVRLRGWILPASVFQMDGIKQFVLVRDNQECCFGPGAALYDCVMVEMQGDAAAKFTTRPVTVEGKFILDEKTYRYPPGTAPGTATHMAVFRIEGTSVR